MANTLPDIVLTGVWVDVYAATGLAAGTNLNIQNKSKYPITIQVATTKPKVTSKDGYEVYPAGTNELGNQAEITDIPEGSKVYVIGEGRISVQGIE